MSGEWLALFEDDQAGWFEPLALTRSVAQLRLGAWTHRERWERRFPDRSLALVCRAAVADAEREGGDWEAVNQLPAADVLFVAAALGRPEPAVTEAIRALAPGRALVSEDRLVAARTAGDASARLADALRDAAGSGFGPHPSADPGRLLAAGGLKAEEIAASWPRTLVDLIGRNRAALAADLPEYDRMIRRPDEDSFDGVHFVAPDHIRLGEGVRLDPGVVLDASEGPILVGPRTRIMANSVVTGPVALGAECRLKPLTRLEASSIGPVVRLGGEVDGSIVLGWSNKQHDGFLGHSYLGAWVNLGAATDTSDLKNDYGPVRLTLAGESFDSGERHVGSLIGDHTKTAIHTRLNTGSVLGVACNLLGADFSPKAVPSFCWGGDGRWSEYRLDKALSVARVVATRRGRVLGDAEAKLLEQVHAASAALRRTFLDGTR